MGENMCPAPVNVRTFPLGQPGDVKKRVHKSPVAIGLSDLCLPCLVGTRSRSEPVTPPTVLVL